MESLRSDHPSFLLSFAERQPKLRRKRERERERGGGERKRESEGNQEKHLALSIVIFTTIIKERYEAIVDICVKKCYCCCYVVGMSLMKVGEVKKSGGFNG